MTLNWQKPVNRVESRTATYRELSSLERRADRNFIKFSENKWQDLQLGKKTLLHCWR